MSNRSPETSINYKFLVPSAGLMVVSAGILGGVINDAMPMRAQYLQSMISEGSEKGVLTVSPVKKDQEQVILSGQQFMVTSLSKSFHERPKSLVVSQKDIQVMQEYLPQVSTRALPDEKLESLIHERVFQDPRAITRMVLAAGSVMGLLLGLSGFVYSMPKEAK